MAQTTSLARPQLVAPRAVQMLEAVRDAAGGFDIDAWHAMEERDNALIADEILHGALSESFVYSFTIKGQLITGVSVVGARHLAAHCGGLKHRLVASLEKTGALFVAQSFPAENMQMHVSASHVPELADQDDFYAAVVELQDIKTGNAVQIERREKRFELDRNGNLYERPNYATIAQSKAYRNAVLALVPQDIVIRWKAEVLRLKKGETITTSVLDEKRSAVLRYAASQGVSLDRRAVEHLTLDQISGLSDAAHGGRLPAFVNSAQALGLASNPTTALGAPDDPTARGDNSPSGTTPTSADRRGRGRGRNRDQQEGETQQQGQQRPALFNE